MARIKIKLRGKVISELPLSDDRQYIAGRKDDADICLQSEKGISREHFRLKSEGGVWSLEVLSRFGDVISLGEKVESSILLEHGQTFSVSPYEFEFLMTAKDAAGALESMGEGSQESNDENIADENEKTFVGVAPSVPYIKIVDKSQEPKELIRLEGGDTWLAGRDPTCNIHIKDQRVSRRQFEIKKTQSGYAIIDLGSVNGTLLNGHVLSGSDWTPLKSGDAITILENHLYFELHDPNFYSRLELVRQQPMAADYNKMLVPMSDSAYLPAEGSFDAKAMQTYQPQSSGELVPYQQPGQGGINPYQQGPQNYPPQTPLNSALGKFDYQKNRPKLIAAVVIFLLVMYLAFGREDQGVESGSSAKIQDPFSKLTPEQKTQVKQSYQLARNYYMQFKYELARSEIIKMNELISEYEDSRELLRLSTEAIEILNQQRRHEELEKAKKEQDEKIHQQVIACRKIINENVTMTQLEECLSPVMAFNPEHPQFLELKTIVESIVAERQRKEAERAERLELIDKLRGIYGRAVTTDKAGDPLKSIDAYEKVLLAKLPDPDRLKDKAQKRISELKNLINEKTASHQAEAEKAYQAQNLKAAIMALRAAKKVDPKNPLLQEKIDNYMLELKKQMMVFYQEGILEESFGNVQGSESKSGAIDKWKKIIEQDVSDGEYYKKAFIKLRKYGAL